MAEGSQWTYTTLDIWVVSSKAAMNTWSWWLTLIHWKGRQAEKWSHKCISLLRYQFCWALKSHFPLLRKDILETKKSPELQWPSPSLQAQPQIEIKNFHHSSSLLLPKEQRTPAFVHFSRTKWRQHSKLLQQQQQVPLLQKSKKQLMKRCVIAQTFKKLNSYKQPQQLASSISMPEKKARGRIQWLPCCARLTSVHKASKTGSHKRGIFCCTKTYILLRKTVISLSSLLKTLAFLYSSHKVFACYPLWLNFKMLWSFF